MVLHFKLTGFHRFYEFLQEIGCFCLEALPEIFRCLLSVKSNDFLVVLADDEPDD